MELNRVYRAQYNIYDIYDIGIYLVRVISGPTKTHISYGEYYVAELVGSDIRIHVYPRDWSRLEMLSSLEEALL